MVCVHVYICVTVRVCEREADGKTDSDRKTDRHADKQKESRYLNIELVISSSPEFSIGE